LASSNLIAIEFSTKNGWARKHASEELFIAKNPGKKVKEVLGTSLMKTFRHGVAEDVTDVDVAEDVAAFSKS
jgi:hypothetical protein